MNIGCLSPLIKQQPKAFVDAKGKKHGHVIVYKDEGGKHAYHYAMRVSVPHTTRTISVAAYAQCTNTKCAHHSDIFGLPQFVPATMFCVMECSRADHRGPLRAAPAPVAEWTGKPNVWSYTTCLDTALDIKCNFSKVTSKCMCPSCGGETQFKIAVATDENCVDVSRPICVMSKRKIPASMRKKTEKEIKAFMDKTRNKKCARQTGRKRSPPLKIRVPPVQRNAPLADAMLLAMTDVQKMYYIKDQDAELQRLQRKLAGLEAQLAKQKELVAATAQHRHKRQKIAAVPYELAPTPVNIMPTCSTPDTFFQLPSTLDRVLEPLSLQGNFLEDDISGLDELDLTGWDI